MRSGNPRRSESHRTEPRLGPSYTIPAINSVCHFPIIPFFVLFPGSIRSGLDCLDSPRRHRPVAIAGREQLKPTQNHKLHLLMDPSSGPPRPALQPPAAEDPPIATAHLARFEFSDAGTKILMVEWYPGAVVEKSTAAAVSAEAPDSVPAADFHDVSAPAPAPGSDAHPGSALAGTTKATGDASTSRRLASTSSSSNWEVSWPGKTTVLRAADADSDSPPASSSSLVDHNSTRRRVYFLLPPEAPVPATITLTPPAGDPRSSLTLKPLPAIFPPGFDAEAGIRGVLHTIWARRRLAALDREMADELRANAESVGLEMALAEKQWIQDTFLKAPPRHSPVSSRSPVASRLGDKLRGLKLATSPADLTPSLSGKKPAYNQLGSPSP